MTWVERLLYNMTFRRVWSAVCVLMLLGGLYFDWSMRRSLPELASFRSPGEVWLTIAYGLAIGLAGAVWERWQLQRHSDEILAFHRLPPGERCQWRHQRANLRRTWWILALLMFFLMSLLVWCAAHMIFGMPALAAMNLPMGLFNARLLREFGAKLRAQAARPADAISLQNG